MLIWYKRVGSFRARFDPRYSVYRDADGNGVQLPEAAVAAEWMFSQQLEATFS